MIDYLKDVKEIYSHPQGIVIIYNNKKKEK